jgi:hypothetical protein
MRHRIPEKETRDSYIIDLDLVEVHAFLGLVETGSIYDEEVNLLALPFVRSFLEDVHSTFVTEITMVHLRVLRVVAWNLFLGGRLKQFEVAGRPWAQRRRPEFGAEGTIATGCFERAVIVDWKIDSITDGPVSGVRKEMKSPLFSGAE